MAPFEDKWYRAQVMKSYDDADQCDLKFVDVGGYIRLPSCELRQIRLVNQKVRPLDL